MFLRLRRQASGAATTGTGQGTATGAVAGGIAETIANAAVKDATFVAITDMQISEKARGGAPSVAATSKSTRSKAWAAASNRRLLKRRRRSAAAPGSSVRRTRACVVRSSAKRLRLLLRAPAPRSCREAQGGRETGDVGIGDSVFDRRSRRPWPLSGGAGGSLGTAARGIRRRSVPRSRQCFPR